MSNDEQNWRIGTDAEDYFRGQKKTTTINARQPLIRRASDLVGPGIAALATRLDDFNNVLATYNGFFSADSTASNGPSAHQYVGVVSSDIELGGMQIFMRIDTGALWKRPFTRAELDAGMILWGSWALV